MASVGKWEVVGKGGKKKSHHDGKKTKVKATDMPKAEIKDPFAQSQSLFEVFNVKKKVNGVEQGPKGTENGFVKNHTKSNQGEDLANGKSHVQKIKKQSTSRKKTTAKPQKMERSALEECISKLEVDPLKATLEELEIKFPTSQLIWLKDMATYLHVNLKDFPLKDPTFDDQTQDFPSCLLAKPLKDFIHETLRKCSSPSTLKLFFEFCIAEMVLNINRGQSAYGMQIMIQCLAESFSDPFDVIKLEEFQEMFRDKKSRAREALAILWTVAQLAYQTDLRQGCKVWLKIMLPVLGNKQFSKFAVLHLETLLEPHEFTMRNDPLLESVEFLSIMDYSFSPTSPLASNLTLQKKMEELYHKLKAMSFNCDVTDRATSYFPTLLKYLGKDLPRDYLQEVLSCLVTCLQANERCFQQWVECYPKYLRESSVLLKFCLREEENSLHKLPAKPFLQVVKSFQEVNDELVEKGKEKNGLEESIKICNEVLMKGKKKRKLFSFKRLFKLALFVTLCYVVYDIYKHKSYGASKTGKFMKRNGIEDAAIEGYIATKGFCIEANSWVQAKYPVYYTKFREYSDPAMDFAAEKLTIVGTFVAEKTKPARDYLNEKVPLFIEKVEKELPIYTAVVRDHLYRVWKNYGPVVKHYLNKTWEFLQEYVPIVLARIRELFEYIANTIYDFAPDFFAKVAKGIEELGERISEKLPEVLSMIKEYAIIAINLAISGVSNAMAAIQEAINSSDSDDTAGPAVQPQAAAGTGKTVPK